MRLGILFHSPCATMASDEDAMSKITGLVLAALAAALSLVAVAQESRVLVNHLGYE